MPNPPTTFMERLVLHRNKRKLSQEQLAEAAGVSQRTVSNWEAGESEPAVTQLIKLAKEQQHVPTRPAKTKDGRDHPQRRLVHRPSFDAKVASSRREMRNIQTGADRALTLRKGQRK